jgi:hypothetical protein
MTSPAQDGYEQQRDLLQRRAERAQQLVHAESSEAQQEQAAEKHIDAKIKSYAHLELQYLFEQIRAYEYTFLTRYRLLKANARRT